MWELNFSLQIWGQCDDHCGQGEPRVGKESVRRFYVTRGCFNFRMNNLNCIYKLSDPFFKLMFWVKII